MMRVIFNSLEEVLVFVKNANAKAVDDCGEEMVRILERTIRDQVSGYEGHLFNAVEVSNKNDTSVEVEVADYQGWTSLAGSNKGQPFENAMIGLEGGYTWGRDATNIMETATEESENKIPIEYKNMMNSLGVPVK